MKPKVSHILLLILSLLAVTLKSATLEKTIYVTVGSTFTISPWHDARIEFPDYICASTSCIARDGDAYALTINTATTTNTRYQAYGGDYYDGYFSSYKVEALQVGTYIINGLGSCYNYSNKTVRVGNVNIIYHIIVSAKPVVTSINIPSNVTLTIGDTYTFSPVIVESGASTTLTWSSNSPNIVSVDNNGNIKAISSGIASIRCVASNGVAAECLVTVKPVLANGVTLNHQELTIEQGQKATLTATVLPTNTTNTKVEWSSSEPGTALVSSDGIVVGLQPGWSIIMATTTDGSAKSATCMVEVKAPLILAETITMNKSELTLTKGYTVQLQAVISPNTVSNNQIEWSTNNDCISVDEHGNITAVKVGNAIVSATTKDGTNLSCQCSVSVKERDVATYDNIIYFEEAIVSSGSTFTLPLMLNNKADITAIQFDLKLPEGVDIQKKSDNVSYNISFNEQSERTDISSHSISNALQEDGAIRVICYSTGLNSFFGNSGAILDIPLEISEEITLGEHLISIENIVLTDKNETKYTIDNYSSLLNVISATLGDSNADDVVDVADIVALANHILGNTSGTFLVDAADLNGDGNIDVADIVSLANKILSGTSAKSSRKAYIRNIATHENVSRFEIVPFVMTAGQKSNNLALDLYNNEEFTAFQLDLSLPEGLNIDLNRRGSAFNLSFNTEYDRTDATYHTLSSAEQSNGDVRILCYSTSLEVFWGNEGTLINIPVTASADMAPGIYSFRIKNIVLTKPDETKVIPADYRGSIIIGNGGNVDDIKLYGAYSGEALVDFSAALSSNTYITGIDMTEASVLNGVNAELNTGNPNTLIYVKDSNALGNTKNIVVDENCYDLNLTDGHPFNASKPFTASEASYARTVSAPGWYSICLPFSADASAGVEVERYGSFDESTSELVFNRGDVDAYKPCIFNAPATGEVAFTATNVEVAATPAVAEDGMMVGAFSKVEGSALTGCYALKADGTGFGTCGSNTYVPPFRAYVKTSATGANVLKLVHGGDVTGIDEVVESGDLLISVQDGECTVKAVGKAVQVCIHSLDGRLVKKMVLAANAGETVILPAGIYMINKNKIIVK